MYYSINNHNGFIKRIRSYPLWYLMFFGILLTFAGGITFYPNYLLSQSLNPFRATVTNIVDFRAAPLPDDTLKTCFLTVQLSQNNQTLHLNDPIRFCRYRRGDSVVVYTDKMTAQVTKPVAQLLLSTVLFCVGIFLLAKANQKNY